MKKRNNNSFDRAKSAAFTGHRYYDFSRKEIIRQRLSRAIVEAYDNGIRNFISGFATGIDLMAAQTVQSLKLSPRNGAHRRNTFQRTGWQVQTT